MHQLLVFGSAVGAGMINSVAGGGTLLSFPTLIWLGVPSIPPMPPAPWRSGRDRPAAFGGSNRPVPLLIFFATCLLAAQEAIQRRFDLSAIHTSARSPWLSWVMVRRIVIAIGFGMAATLLVKVL